MPNKLISEINHTCMCHMIFLVATKFNLPKRYLRFSHLCSYMRLAHDLSSHSLLPLFCFDFFSILCERPIDALAERELSPPDALESCAVLAS